MTTMTATTAPDPVEEEPGRGRSRKLLVVLLVVVVASASAWFLVLRPSGPEEPVPGEVVALEPIQVNLAAGHYLRIGLALQLSADAHEVDGSKALDAAIEVFSGLEMSEVSRPEQRQDLRSHLEKLLHERYHGDVLEVYLTEFVTQ